VPWVIYCRPELAWCGLAGAQAQASHDVYQAPFRGDRGPSSSETGGRKLVTDADGGARRAFRGSWATELLAEGYLSVNWEANAADLAALVHPHPTLSEVFGEAAMTRMGRPLH
jgi:dihydrolipoamide dehydrogenase